MLTKRKDTFPQFWKSPDGLMYELIGFDKNNDAIMKPLDENAETKCISSRALNRTFHPRWRSLCCDRWLTYQPVTEVTCFH